jgi:hypothetical protein
MSDTDQSRGDELPSLALPISDGRLRSHKASSRCSLVTNTRSLSDHKIQIEIKIAFILGTPCTMYAEPPLLPTAIKPQLRFCTRV